MLKKWEHVSDVGRKQLPVKRLYRYMPLDACRRMVEYGDVRVSSSTSFTDEALTETRRDDEAGAVWRIYAADVRRASVRFGFGATS